jgi:ketosteroid isomerase-like protein
MSDESARPQNVASQVDLELVEAGVRAFNERDVPKFAETGDTWQQLTVVCDELRRLEDGVLVLGCALGRGLGSGAEVQTPLAFIVTIRGGRISKVSTYLIHENALKAAGLER